jgi:signal transduction histidine kinase
MAGCEDARLCLGVRDAHDPRTGESGIRLIVADTGSGMSQATLTRMWEPFFTTKGATGTGLGLWVTQEIIRKHRGVVSVRSRTGEENHGSVFSVFFPHMADGRKAL